MKSMVKSLPWRKDLTSIAVADRRLSRTRCQQEFHELDIGGDVSELLPVQGGAEGTEESVPLFQPNSS